MPDAEAGAFCDFATLTSAAFIKLGADLRIAWLEGDLETLAGLSPQALLGRHLREVAEQMLHAAPDQVERLAKHLLAGQSFAALPLDGRRPDGGTVRLELAGRPLADGAHLAGFRLVARSRVAPPAGAEDFVENNFWLATAQRVANLGLWRLNPASGEVRGSAEYYRLLGLEPDGPPMTADRFLRLVHPADRDRVTAFYHDVLTGRGPMSVAYRLRPHGGRTRHCVCNADALRDRAGRVVAVTGVMQDITEHKRAEEAIRVHEARLARAQRLARMGSWEWNAGTGEFWWSEEQYHLFGVDPKGFQPTLQAFLDLVHPDDRERIHDLVRRPRKGTLGQQPYEFRAVVEGETRVFRGCTESWRDLDGNIVVSGTMQDITEQRAAEEGLRAAKERAEYASRAKSQFLATMSHELRTPLNAILGFAEMMKLGVLGPLDVRYREYAENIYESGSHLRALIDDILDVSRIEVGAMDLNEEQVILPDVVAGVLRILRPRAEKGRVRLTEELPPLPVIHADPRLLKQVLLNLAGNAVKFTPEGGEVRIGGALRKRGGRGRPWLCITVADTGIGMAPEDIPRALEPFSQLEGPAPRRHEGVGLGLHLCRRMVEMHGGRLQLQSAPGKGTTASVWLPPRRLLPEGVPAKTCAR